MVTVERPCGVGSAARSRAAVAAEISSKNKKHPTPNGGSLGSWIDEDRSYLRVVV